MSLLCLRLTDDRPRYRCFALDAKEENEEEAMMMAAIRLNYDRGGTARCAASEAGGAAKSPRSPVGKEKEEDEVVRPMTYKCPKPKKPVGGGRCGENATGSLE